MLRQVVTNHVRADHRLNVLSTSSVSLLLHATKPNHSFAEWHLRMQLLHVRFRALMAKVAHALSIKVASLIRCVAKMDLTQSRLPHWRRYPRLHWIPIFVERLTMKLQPSAQFHARLSHQVIVLLMRHVLHQLLVQTRTHFSVALLGKRHHLPVQGRAKQTVNVKMGKVVSVILLARRRKRFTVELPLMTLLRNVVIRVLLAQTTTVKTEKNVSSTPLAMKSILILLMSQ